MTKYRVTLFDIQNQSLEAHFVVDNIPHKGLVYCYDGIEWEVVKVRQHIRSDSSVAAQQNAPHIVDVLVRKIDGFFAL